jgi:hypothetical protein
LIDALVVHGDAKAVAAGLVAHLDAGADHVCAQILVTDEDDYVPAASSGRGARDGLTDALGLR